MKRNEFLSESHTINKRNRDYKKEWQRVKATKKRIAFDITYELHDLFSNYLEKNNLNQSKFFIGIIKDVVDGERKRLQK